MPITLNLKDVKTDFEPVPPGNYLVQITKAQHQMSKSSNQPMIAAQFRIVDPEEHEGRILFAHFSLQAHALFGIKNFLEALGYDVDRDGIELEPEELVGQEVIAIVTQEPDNQNPETMRNRVKAYVSAGEAVELDVEDVELEFDIGDEY